MTKAKPCAHARWERVKLFAAQDHIAEGQPPAPLRQRFRVMEVLRCVRCDTGGTRWTRFYGQTERAALKRAGMPEDQLPAPPNHKDKGAVVMALTSWPFPAATHKEPGRRG